MAMNQNNKTVIQVRDAALIWEMELTFVKKCLDLCGWRYQNYEIHMRENSFNVSETRQSEVLAI
jgi:hypothetical protein